MMPQSLTIQHLETLWQANQISSKTKAVVFELSQYSNDKGLELILCTSNVGTCQKSQAFRDSGKLDGLFSFEYDGIQFLRDEKNNNIIFPESIIEKDLDKTLNIFREFSVKAGFAHCESLGRYAKNKKSIIFHVWMGNNK